MNFNILLLGKDGQLGRAIMALLDDRVRAASRDDVDFASAGFIDQLEAFMDDRKISAVINAAAYTHVDKAEGSGMMDAVRINAEAVDELAKWCARRRLPLIHFSTDYVFDGTGTRPWQEGDPLRPINAYGQSKLQGERAIAAQKLPYLIFRTSWVYDAHGKNFYTTILRLLQEKESLDVVSDQIGAPTYAPHLAKAVLEILEKALGMPKFPSGIYHLCSGGETSWHGFAQEIFALASKEDSSIRCRQVNPISSFSYPLPAVRPLNSRLDCARAMRAFGVAMPQWREGLKECVNETYEGAGLPDKRIKNRPA